MHYPDILVVSSQKDDGKEFIDITDFIDYYDSSGFKFLLSGITHHVLSGDV